MKIYLRKYNLGTGNSSGRADSSQKFLRLEISNTGLLVGIENRPQNFVSLSSLPRAEENRGQNFALIIYSQLLKEKSRTFLTMLVNALLEVNPRSSLNTLCRILLFE